MSKINNQLERMKAMMVYGLQTESKKGQYADIEYQREGADGKLYGIVREGTKFYIKVSDKTKNALKEDFNYIGGFRNRKENEYSSYANALKQFDLKMISLKEAKGNTKLMVESWNPEMKEMLMVEATESMKNEINRQREIMNNAKIISENVNNYSVNMNESCCDKVDKTCKEIEKKNVKGGKHECCGDVSGNGGDPFTKCASGEFKNTQKTNIGKPEKPVTESEQVLSWNEDEDYLDTTSGTEVGDTAPFTDGKEKKLKNGTVEEGVAMHKEGENQNSPKLGVNKIGDTAPFDEKPKDLREEDELDDTEDVEDVDSDFDDFDDTEDVEDFDDTDDSDDTEDVEDFDDTDDSDFEVDLEDETSDDFNSDIENRLSAIEDMLSKISEKIGVDAFEDDDLYDDSDDAKDVEDFDDYEGDDFDDTEDFDDFDDTEEEDDDTQVFESKSYRRMKMLKEDRMDYFGKHPAYRKEPMGLPSNKHQEKQGYFDINDDSAESESPYGENIGDSAPFEIDIETIENAIAESIKRHLKKKI